MDTARSPFVEKETACPACGKSFAQRYLRSRAYVPGDRESDQHVVNYRWPDPAFTPVHPPYYFLFHCPHCYFTDLCDDFSEPSNTPLTQRLLKCVAAPPEKEKLMVELLRRHVNYAEIDFGSALNLHFIVLIQQQLPAREFRDYYKIARIYLRIAWLYREQAIREEGGAKLPAVEAILKDLKEFDVALYALKEKCETLTHAIDVRVAEQEAEVPQNTENPYRPVSVNLMRMVENAFREDHKIKEICRRDQEGTLFDETASGANAFFSFGSYQDFLNKLKDLWPLVPADETEAMRAAIQSFERAISTDPRFEDPKAYHGVLALILDLMVRCDDLKGAFSMVGSLFRTDNDTRMRLQKKLQDKDLEESAKKRLRNEVDRVSASIQEIGQLRRDLMDQIVARDKPRILEILEQNSEASAEEIDSLLEDAGMLPEIIVRLKDKGGLLESVGKKKRRFF